MIKINGDVKGLIFDLDGTLANTMPTHLKTWKETAKEFGFEYPESYFWSQAGQPPRKILENYMELNNLDIDPDQFMKTKLEKYHQFKSEITPIKPVFDFMKNNYGKLPMAIGTGGCSPFVEDIVSIVGASDYINIIVKAEDVNKHKPEPDTFLKCAELMGIEPQYCHVFEDADNGIEAAKKAGMQYTDVRDL